MKKIITNWLGVVSKKDFEKLDKLVGKPRWGGPTWSFSLLSYFGGITDKPSVEEPTVFEKLEKLEEYLGIKFENRSEKIKKYVSVKKKK